MTPKIPVYAYTEDDEYMSVTGQTDENSVLVIELVDANVQFRVDAENKTQWSDVVPTNQDEIVITLNPCGVNQYLAEYFNIRYDWDRSSPAEDITTDNFSAAAALT